MSAPSRMYEELIKENASLRQKIRELEESISKFEQIAESDKERELKYRSLIEHSSDVVFCVDKRGEYKFVNQVFASTFGKTPDYFLGKTFWDVYPKEHADHRQAASIKVFETGESQSVEVVVPLPDRTLHYLAKANPVRDETGEVVFNVTHAIDITDRKRAEEALKESERKYRLLADNIQEVFWMATPNVEKMVYISPAYEKVWGRSCESLYESPLSFNDAIHPEDKDIVANTLELARANNSSWDSTYRIMLPDGSIRWIEDRGYPVYDDQGNHYLNAGVAKDITDRRQMEDALRESEENFRSFFSAMDDMIIVGTPDGKIMYSNPAMTRKLSYTSEELLNMHVLDVHPHDKRSEAEAIFSSMFKGELDVYPLPLQSKTGNLIPVETRVWFGTWSGAPCIFGLSKDLSKEQEALQKFNRLFVNNPAPMAVSTIPERIFTDINVSFINKLGYSRSEIIGRTSEELDLFVQPEKLNEISEQLIKDGHVSDIELKVKCKDSSILDGIFFGEIIESQGQNYFLTVMVDQTDRKKTEAKLRMSEERNRRLFESELLAISIIDTNNLHFIDVNDTHIKLYGYTREELLGDMISTTLSADPEISSQSITNVMSSGSPFHIVERMHKKKDGTIFPVEIFAGPYILEGRQVIFASVHDISERKQAEEERQRLIDELKKALSEIKVLSGLLPICASCKKIRDDEGYWNQIEVYIGKHSDAQFSHGICPECAKKLYPEIFEEK